MVAKIVLAIVTTMSAVGWAAAGGEMLDRVELKGEDRRAVCNDGSPPSYYWKKSQTGSNRWLIWLMGDEDFNEPQQDDANLPPGTHMLSNINYAKN